MSMSDKVSSGAVKPMKVDKNQFLGAIWTLLAIAILCSAFRFLVRARVFKKFLLDDYFVIAALIFATANAIIWQIFATHFYYIMSVAAGLEMPGTDFTTIAESYWKSNLVVIILYYSALWAVKLSFLVFFKRLGANVEKQKLLWWFVFIFTMATYFACIGDISYGCLISDFEWIHVHCVTQQAGHFNQVTLKVNCALDVLSDFLIMLIPFHLLHGVRISRHRKFILTGIFSLVIVTMIISILRTGLVGSRHSSLPDSSWLYLWSAIEVSVAIMVTSATSFRNLFSRESGHVSPHSFRSLPPENRPRNRILELIDTLASTNAQTSTYNVQEDGVNIETGTPVGGTTSSDELALKRNSFLVRQEATGSEETA